MLKIENLSFKYSGSDGNIFRNISLNAAPGELICIMGDSGSGKSTLLKTINGIIPSVIRGDLTGTVKIFDKEVKEYTFHELSKIVGCLFQNVEYQLLNNYVHEEIYSETVKNTDIKNIDAYIDDIILQFDIMKHKNSRINELSLGNKQKVALSSMIAAKSKILLLDEPFSNLDQKGADNLVQTLKRIKNKKDSIIIIVEHQVSKIIDITDKFLIFKDGTAQTTSSTKDIINIWDMNNNFALSPKSYEVPVLEAKNLRFGYKDNMILDNISFQIMQGEIIGLLGDNGTGKSTLAQVLTGLKKPEKGEILFKGKKYNWKKTPQNIGFIMQNPLHQLFCDTVMEEISFSLDNFNVSDKTKVDDLLEILNLSKLKHRHIHTLSFGEQQRTAIIAGISLLPDLIIMDEPALGQDSNTLRMIIDFMLKERNNGKSFLIISHLHELVNSISDRVWQIEGGKIHERE